MYDDHNSSGGGEREAAEDRLARIRGGSGSAAPSGSQYGEDPLGSDSESMSRARSRARDARAAIRDESQSPVISRADKGGRGMQGMMVIGGVVLIGVLVVVAIVLGSSLFGGGGGFNLFPTKTPTPTPTATPTATPPPTETPTPTKEAPSNLQLPVLECLYRSDVGCSDFCRDSANAAACQSARSQLESQRVNPDVWFECVSPGSGPNQGDPDECLDEAWRAANP